MQKIARVIDGVVVNTEMADADWISHNDGVDGVRFIPFDDDHPAHIGFKWDQVNGFEQPNYGTSMDAS